jgi:hypothetical protein
MGTAQVGMVCCPLMTKYGVLLLWRMDSTPSSRKPQMLLANHSSARCQYPSHPLVSAHLAPIIAVFALSKNLSIPT